MTAPKPIRMEVNFRNNFILSMMEDKGIKSLSNLAKASGCTYVRLCSLVAMKTPALNKDGSWQKDALRLSNLFKCMPEELFSSDQRVATLETNRVQVEIDYAETQLLDTVQSTSDKIAEAKELKRNISHLLLNLSPREQNVLSLLFGLNGNNECSIDEVAYIFNVTAARIRQIEAKSLIKLRRFIRSGSVRIIAGTGTLSRADIQLEYFDRDVLEALSQA